MTHDELLNTIGHWNWIEPEPLLKALRAVVGTVQAYEGRDVIANEEFDQGVRAVCRVIIQAIEKELK